MISESIGVPVNVADELATSSDAMSMGGVVKGVLCPNCMLPMAVVLSIKGGAIRGIEEDVVLIYCWRCAIPRGVLLYSWPKFSVISCSRGAGEPGFPYDNYPREFLRYRVDIGVQGQAVGVQRQSQVLGRPFMWEGRVRDLSCPECGRDMRLLASVWDPEVPISFCGNCDVQMVFVWCRRHGIIGAYHAVS
jgi:hypothetical protein